MPTDESPASLELLIARSRAAAERAQANEATAGEHSPAPGEVYVLAETADFPVEWALIERHPDDLRRFWAVPADTHPFAGEGDVEVPAEAPGGFLVLRCAWGVWLRNGALPQDGRSRVLAPEFLEEARRAVATARERRAADPAWQPGGESPEILDWSQEVLLPACAAIAAAAADRSELPALRLPQRRLARWLPWAVAAGLLITLTGVSVVWLGQRRQTEQQVANARSQLTQARQEQLNSEDLWTQRMEDLEREGQAEAQALERQIAELIGGSSPAEPLVNLPQVTLHPADVRRSLPTAVRIPAERPYLLAVLSLPQGANFPAYRLILQQDTKTLWQSRRLTGVRDREIVTLLPRKWLSSGNYRLRLEGLRLGQGELVAEYSLPISR